VFQSSAEAILPNALTGSIVEHVRRPSSYLAIPYGAVTVAGRDLSVSNVGQTVSEIRDGGPGVTGLLVSGASTVSVTGQSRIYENEGGGLLATGGADVTVSQSTIEANPGGTAVQAAGYDTVVRLWGANVSDNIGVGVRAYSNAEVRFGN